MSYRGDIRLAKTIDLKFTTRQSTGAPFTLAGTPVISAYPDNSTTQITAGITLTVDFDGVTGANNVRVVATGANGYATATNYDLMITTGTVNSVSVVGEIIGAFSIENRSGLMPATVDRTLVVDAAGLADANIVKVGPSGSGTAQTAKDIGAAVPAAVPGAAGGLFIAGSNAATTFATLTVTGATTLTGHVLLSDGMNIAAPSTTDRDGLKVSGNGAGHAFRIIAGASANGIHITASGAGNDAIQATGGAGGAGARLASFVVSGVTTLSGAVSLGSTLAITGGTTLAALTASGIVTMNNAGNDIQGITLTAAQQAAVVTAIMAVVIETGVTFQNAIKAILASAANGSAGFPGAGVKTFSNPAGTKSRITSTTDADGNRGNPTFDFT